VRTASTYLELAMVRHSLELLRKEQESADKSWALRSSVRRKISSYLWR